MKYKIKYLTIIALGALLLNACEINDPVNDLVRTGHLGANVYYEVPNTNIKAGEDVDFYTEYWSVDKKFNALELWYDIESSYKYVLSSGINDYSITLDSVEMARESQVIVDYQHSESSYDTEKAAYVIEDAFPVSYTLAPAIIENPGMYDEDQVNSIFPSSFIQQFYAGLFETLDYELLHLVIVEQGALMDEETFNSHFDVVEELDPDTGEVISTTMVMKEESVPVLFELFQQVALQDLIYNPNTFAYQITYSKMYTLGTKFRVVNGNEVEVFSEVKEVEIN